MGESPEVPINEQSPVGIIACGAFRVSVHSPTLIEDYRRTAYAIRFRQQPAYLASSLYELTILFQVIEHVFFMRVRLIVMQAYVNLRHARDFAHMLEP